MRKPSENARLSREAPGIAGSEGYGLHVVPIVVDDSREREGERGREVHANRGPPRTPFYDIRPIFGCALGGPDRRTLFPPRGMSRLVAASTSGAVAPSLCSPVFHGCPRTRAPTAGSR